MSNRQCMHVWVGIYRGNDEEWERYFDVDQYGGQCGFCQETGMEWFDMDMFSTYNAGTVLRVEDVIEEVPWSGQFREELLAACRTCGVTEGTDCVALSDFDDGQAEIGEQYCGLTYVGGFSYLPTS